VISFSFLSYAAEGVEVGIVDRTGTFVPKARIRKIDSTMQVTKIDAEEKFGSLKIRFLSPIMDQAPLRKGLHVQWEIAPGQFGRLRPLMDHGRFRRRDGVLNTTWQRSRSFRLVDRSHSASFASLPWHKLTKMWLDGNALVSRSPVPPPAQERSSPTPPAHGIEERGQRARAEPPRSAAPDRPVATAPAVDPAAVRAMEAQIKRLDARIAELESAVQTNGRWLYWGPLAALGLAILFSSVVVFFTFSRLSSTGTSYKINRTPRYNNPTVRMPNRFRNTG
jgi:hypothetical protein